MAGTVAGPPVDVSCLVQSFDSGPVVVPMAALMGLAAPIRFL